MSQEKLKKAIKILKDHGVKVTKKDVSKPNEIIDQVKELGYAYDETGREFYDKRTTGTINFKLPEFLDSLDFVEFLREKISEYENAKCVLMNDIKISKKYDKDNNLVDGYNGCYLMYKFEVEIDDTLLEELEELDLDE